MSSLEVTRLIVTIHRSSNKAMGKMMQNELLNVFEFLVNFFTRWTREPDRPGTGVWPASREEQPGGDVKGTRSPKFDEHVNGFQNGISHQSLITMS